MKNLAILGFQQSGKSTLAWYLSRALKIPIFKWAEPLYQVQRIFSSTKSREILEGISDVVKVAYGPDIVFKAGLRLLKDEQDAHQFLINDDLRFQREFDYVLANDWYLVFIDAPAHLRKARAEAQGLTFTENHASEHLFRESNLDQVKAKCDLVIYNNLEDQYQGKILFQNQAEKIAEVLLNG